MKKPKLKINDWYTELNDRQKRELKKIFFDLGMARPTFYKMLNRNTLDIGYALMLEEFFSRELMPCTIRDFYRSPIDILAERERSEKKKEGKSPSRGIGLPGTGLPDVLRDTDHAVPRPPGSLRKHGLVASECRPDV